MLILTFFILKPHEKRKKNFLKKTGLKPVLNRFLEPVFEKPVFTNRFVNPNRSTIPKPIQLWDRLKSQGKKILENGQRFPMFSMVLYPKIKKKFEKNDVEEILHDNHLTSIAKQNWKSYFVN